MSISRRYKIKTWKKFAKKVRSKSNDLLVELDKFNDAVLVTGCQRSGTTALSRVITNSKGMVKYKSGKDDELDAALILSGAIMHKPQGRYCFQTTYLNDNYRDYYKHRKHSFKIIWIIRNPLSVVYSMLHNWGKFAFKELFLACGHEVLSDNKKLKYKKYRRLYISRLHQACLSYEAKYMQLFELHKVFSSKELIVVDYDNLVKNKNEILPVIYKFIQLPYTKSYGDMLHNESISKARKFSDRNIEIIQENCGPIYQKAKQLSL